ncbi:hypothetical protein PV783_34215 [Chitinophaga sp. CC14]|uniref:hypothetical protein n=1 Tax=Chitinophaga sp. CC14 TaxID=3029199 RepID=UPI003B7F8EEC
MAKINLTKLVWDNPPSAAQLCTVAYRKTADPDIPGSYTTVSSAVTVNTDGTIPGGLAITGLATETSYTVKASDNCGSAAFLKVFITPLPQCPAGYQLSDDHTYCWQEDVEPAEQSGGGSTYIICQNTNSVYSTFATRVYKENGYSQNGVPLAGSQYTPTNIQSGTFWYNPNANTTDGPLNRMGIWPCDGSGNPCGNNCAPSGVQVGFSRQFNVPATALYYIGVGSDNYSTITIQDGIAGRRVIVQQDPEALRLYYNSSSSGDITFKSFHIYPVRLNSGPNILELTATNDSATAAVMGAEVYLNTEAQLIAADSIADLNIIFSTDVNQGFISVHDPIELGNWNCDNLPGYSLQYRDPDYVCVKIETTPVIS